MPPTRTSPCASPYRPSSLSSLPFKFRRKSLSEDDLPRPDHLLLPPLSPSRSLSALSSSPPSSPSVLSTSPSAHSHPHTSYLPQPSSPLHPAPHRVYGYPCAYPQDLRALPYDSALLSPEHPSKPLLHSSHPHPITSPTSTRSSYPSASPFDLDSNHLFSSSPSHSISHHDEEDELEDTYGFALDVDGILGASSPSRRVSFTTSSERDQPLVRPPQPVSSKTRTRTRAKKFYKAAPALVRPENLRLHTPLGVPDDAALSEEAPRPPSTPVRPRTRSHSPHTRTVDGVAETDADDALPPSSPIQSPLSSPLSSPGKDGQSRDHDRARDLSLPPSSPIPIPYSPARESYHGAELEMDFMPSPPSPTLDALRITSRVSLRALLNPMPEPECVRVREFSSALLPDASREVSSAVVADGDITPLVLGELEAELEEASSVIEAVDVIPESAPGSSAQSRLPLFAPSPSPSPSRASTPDHAMTHDIPSSPLSSPPRSVADERDVANTVDMDIDFLDGLPPSSPIREAKITDHVRVPSPCVAPSRAVSRVRSVSVKREESVQPPWKKARRESSAEASSSRVSPAITPDPIANEVKTLPDPAVQVPAVLGPEVQALRVAAERKPAHRKRRRIVWSDDESETESPAAPPPRPQPQDQKRKDKAREKAKKSHVKGTIADDDIENEPLEGAAAPCIPKARPSAKAGPRSAAPTSATNVAHPSVRAKDEDDDDEVPRAKKQEHKPKAGGAQAKSKSQSERGASSVCTEERAPACAPAPAPAPSPKRARKDRPARSEEEGPGPAEYTLPLPGAELEGMLIETLATARASSLSTSALYGALMAARPVLREMALPVLVGSTTASVVEGTPGPGEAQVREGSAESREGGGAQEGAEETKKGKGRGRGAKADADAASRRAWVPALEGVLEAGWRRSGVFGKVVNCGTDAGDQELALEPRWFYDPERDEDGERAGLVRSMMRRPGKRSETKKAKQYYWRPLPKISRWDPEDEL